MISLYVFENELLHVQGLISFLKFKKGDLACFCLAPSLTNFKSNKFMNIEPVSSYEELSLKAKDVIVESIKKKNELLLCAATGDSPTGTYQLLVEEFQKNKNLFSSLNVIKLDEWGGVSMNQQGTCESYLQKHLIQPLQIPQSRYINFNSNSDNPDEECASIQKKIIQKGPVDLCILGLGSNGHLALNEPGEFLQPYCHLAELAPSSLNHNMTTAMDRKPTYGLTLGMADIMNSKQILMLVSGRKKKETVKRFLSRKITTNLPASFLWLHPNVICLIEKDTMEDIG
jgi:6-phosphogluconolactonase/Glucosamine-6-phosphate isomerase/deaminase